MQDFFHGKFFKVLLFIAALLIGFMIYAVSTSGFSTVTSQIAGAVSMPFQKLSSYLSGAATDFFGKFVNAEAYYQENQELKQQLADLRKQMVDYEDLQDENRQLREINGIKEEIPDVQQMVSASVIARDPSEQFGSFTIDKGSIHGIQPNDAVITSQGLVGRVYEVGALSSKVVTILSPEVKVSSLAATSNEPGILKGEIDLAENGNCKLAYLERSTVVAEGETIVTSGVGGIYPKGILVGTVKEVKPEQHGITSYAVVEPQVDVNSVKDVFVITDFLGKNAEDISDSTEG